MPPFKERISVCRNWVVQRLSRSPFLISYVLLIIPLHLMDSGTHFWRPACMGQSLSLYCYGFQVQNWHLNLLTILVASLVQPRGSLILAPASSGQTFLSRLNPLICMAEGMSTLFTLLSLHCSTSPLSYPAAATLTLYHRESSSLTLTQLEDLTSNESNKANYRSIRTSLGFAPLEPRNISASTPLYVCGLLALIHFMLNRWLYADAPIITMLCFHYIVSFGFLHLAIVLATSRALTEEEHDAVEEQFQAYLVTQQLQRSLAPDESIKKSRRTIFDDSWTRVLLFILSYVLILATSLMLLKLVIHPTRQSRFRRNRGLSLFPWEQTELFVLFPRTLLGCFALMKIGNWNAKVGKWAYWIVALGLMGSYYWIRLSPFERYHLSAWRHG